MRKRYSPSGVQRKIAFLPSFLLPIDFIFDVLFSDFKIYRAFGVADPGGFRSPPLGE